MPMDGNSTINTVFFGWLAISVQKITNLEYKVCIMISSHIGPSAVQLLKLSAPALAFFFCFEP